MASNPLIPQGVLNKLRGSVSVVDLPQLNATQSFLGPEGITIAFEGDASGYIPTMTGAVPSPNPFQMANVTLHLLKTQGLGMAWRSQIETDTTIGDIVITTDTVTFDTYYFTNCTIMGNSEVTVNGSTPEYIVNVRGTYLINSGLFDQ